MTRLDISPADRCFIQILRHILLTANAEPRCTIMAVPFCLETPFLHISFFMVSLIYL